MPHELGKPSGLPDFEWDEAKAAGNRQKHGVSFVDAAKIFLSPHLVAEDRRFNYGEKRYRAIGRVEANILIVVFTLRADAIRIISAWKGGRDDRDRFEALHGRSDRGNGE